MEEQNINLWAEVTSHEALSNAWYKVAANGGGPGGDGENIKSFAADLHAQLSELRAALLNGSYRTASFRRVSIPKKKPGYRILTIPSLRDRVLHTSIANRLTPILEPLFEDSSFGYRPGRGVTHAVKRIEQWRKRGFDTVIEADIVSYFDNIDHGLLTDKVEDVLATWNGSAPLMDLIRQLLVEQGQALRSPGRGLVQGSPLSPLLSNLYLDRLDEEIDAEGVKLVRFADDFVVLCKSERKAEKVLAKVVSVLAEHQLRLHDEGTRIVNFDDGFDFVGYLFHRTLALKKSAPNQVGAPAKPLKSLVTDEGIIELDDNGARFDPGRRTLYLIDADHRLSVRNQSFSVLRDDGTELIAIPNKRVGRIEIGPGVEFGRAAVELAMRSDTPLVLINGLGHSVGFVEAALGRRAGRHLAQAKALLEQDKRLVIAKALVDARISNQRTQLFRLKRSGSNDLVDTAVSRLRQARLKLVAAQDIEQLRGCEGAASACYWPALASLVVADWPFDIVKGSHDRLPAGFVRSRPARDPFNAAINYFTGILQRDVQASIHACELHAGFAFLHGTRDRHQGLVFDLMEPFRAPLTEGLAVFLFNARRLRGEHFEAINPSEIVITKEGRQALVNGYEAAVARRIRFPEDGVMLTWRAAMLAQAQLLAKTLENQQLKSFKPLVMDYYRRWDGIHGLEFFVTMFPQTSDVARLQSYSKLKRRGCNFRYSKAV